MLLIGIHKEARSQVLHLSRNKRYTLTPEKLKWDKLKLTYKYSSTIPSLVYKTIRLSIRKTDLLAKLCQKKENEHVDFSLEAKILEIAMFV